MKVPPKQRKLNRFDELSRKKEEEKKEEDGEKGRDLEHDRKGHGRKMRRLREENDLDEMDSDEVNRMKELARRLSRKMEEDKNKKRDCVSDVKDFCIASSSLSEGSSSATVKIEEVSCPQGSYVNHSENVVRDVDSENRSLHMPAGAKEQSEEKDKKWRIPHRFKKHSSPLKDLSGGIHSSGKCNGRGPRDEEEVESQTSLSLHRKRKRKHKDACKFIPLLNFILF